MAFKKLNQFTFFDFQKFSEGKTFKVVGITPWKDFHTGDLLGTKVTSVIVVDKTHYEVQNGEQVSNLYEKLDFKVSMEKSVPIGAIIVPVNPVAKAWGRDGFANQLSVTCDDIRVLQQPQQQQGAKQ